MEEMDKKTEQGACCMDGHGAGACGKCVEVDQGSWVIAGAVLLGSLIVAASLLVSLKPKAAGDTVGTPTPSQPTAAGQPTAQPTTEGSASLDDDAVLGDRKKAKVAIIEFSDYECPFCKRFHDETYNQIVKDFVDTGKAVVSFRDFPLAFHEPKATEAAKYAQCVKEGKGDAAFFVFNKAYFASTISNGKGLPEGKMDEILKQIGANPATVTACAISDKYKDEIAKDTSDGQASGVSGTPSFIVGKLDSKGNVTGELLVGAQPYPQFKATIEKYLK